MKTLESGTPEFKKAVKALTANFDHFDEKAPAKGAGRRPNQRQVGRFIDWTFTRAPPKQRASLMGAFAGTCALAVWHYRAKAPATTHSPWNPRVRTCGMEQRSTRQEPVRLPPTRRWRPHRRELYELRCFSFCFNI